MSPVRLIQGSKAQHGAATLVVVMVLFLVMALLAGYANRALLFEQRIANSYYRASVAQEMAEAGLEWSLAQLNGEAIDSSCTPTATAGTRFVDRYLSISAADRGIKSGSGGVASTAVDCTRAGSGWTCRCPALGSWAAPSPVSGTAMTPSFGITIQAIPPYMPAGAGTIQLSSSGCTDSVVSSCIVADVNSKASQGTSVQHALIALVSAVRSPPVAPLVVKGDVVVAGTGLGLHNTDPRSAGLLYDVKGTVSGFNDSRLNSVPGTSPSLARIANDNTLPSDGVEFFRMFMGAVPDRYELHPSLRKVTCSSDCGGTLASAYTAGKRIIWVDGDMAIQSNQTLGSASDPVVIIAEGNVDLAGAFQLNGILVARGNVTWTNTSAASSLIVGMLLAEGNVTTNGSMDIVYQPAIADQLRNRVGSFVRVPGGWTDIQ
jgi:hypothetical protein